MPVTAIEPFAPQKAALPAAERWETVLDLLALLNAPKRFMGVAMTLCNEVAARFGGERACLGWVARGRVRLLALSHTEKFERRMSAVAAVEAAMEETRLRDEEILFPALAEEGADVRDHAALARAQALGALLSLPIRVDGEPVAVLLLERAPAAPQFTVADVQTLRLLCDLTARRLSELRRHDRWFGARAGTWIVEQGSRLVGPEHTAAKLGVLAGSLALAVLLFWPAEYRPEAPFVLKSTELAQVPAPFDGYLEQVQVRAGDFVTRGTPLLTLDSRDLVLEQAAAAAERQRFLAEAQKAESANQAGDMQIAQAAADEAQARLDLARHRLALATVVAPFDGYVIEGDLRERLASPVKQGEVLVKVARIEAMTVKLAMPERDVHELAAGQTGTLAFASQPQFTFPFRVERIDPVAEAGEKGGVFTVRGVFAGPAETWWRPGMTGLARVNAGRRSLLWIFTHRTADYLRLKLWW